MNHYCRRFEQKEGEYQQDEPKRPGNTVFHVTLQGAGECIEAEQRKNENG